MSGDPAKPILPYAEPDLGSAPKDVSLWPSRVFCLSGSEAERSPGPRKEANANS